MNKPSAIERLAALNPGTEIWWDSSPLIYAGWRDELSATWRERPALLEALEQLGGLPNAQGREYPAQGLIRGSTTNPPLVWKAIESDRERWDTWTRHKASDASSANDLTWSLYGEVCKCGAALLEPIYHASQGRYGHICAQVDPRGLTDLEAMLARARFLHNLADNIMIKMPATKEGIEGIRILIGEGISTTATLCFSVSQLLAVAEAARLGFLSAASKRMNLTALRSCAALMLGRMEEAPQFRRQATELGLELSDADLRWAGIAVARKAYHIYRVRGYKTRLLCASMRLGPVVDGETRIWHLERLAGGEMVHTIFPNIMASYLELYADRPIAPSITDSVPEEVLDKLLQVPYFVQAYDENALTPDDYIDLPGVQITGGGFATAMQTIEDYAAGMMIRTA